MTKSKTDLQVSVAVQSAAFWEVNANRRRGPRIRARPSSVSRSTSSRAKGNELVADPQAVTMLLGGLA